MKQTLGKPEKLKSRKQIDQLFKARKFVTESPIRLFYDLSSVKESGTGNAAGYKTVPIQVGFSCSKKFFKQAARRNRVKRLLREAYRRQKAPLWQFCEQNDCSLSLFWLYGHKELPAFSEIEEKVGKLLQMLTGKLEKKLEAQ